MTRPSVVALGGGHGLASTLSAARTYAATLTAVVSVADDGGSSGRLRETFGIQPPGDLRKCLVALGDPKSVWTGAFEHRFKAGELDGHALGNLVIAGLTGYTGSFLDALEEAGRLVRASGKVLPATVSPVVLKAEAADGQVEGQVAVSAARRIRQVSLVPPDPEPPREALDALASADQVLIGPGSLFTSVLAVVAVPAIREALRTTPATKVYVCNLAPQVAETAGFDVAAHVEALHQHGLDVDTVVCDTTGMPLGRLAVRHVDVALAGPGGRAHDPRRLATALSDLLGWERGEASR